MWNKRNAGVTLVELIVALVIVGVALAGMVAVFTRTSRASVDPMINQQMAAIADNMMEEILLKPFVHTTAGTTRATFDDVLDYNGYSSTGIVDVEGNAVGGLQDYSVSVKVASPGAPLTGLAAPVPTADTLRIEVTVSYPRGGSGYKPIVLVGWRTKP